jgi:Spy/CpxP family protein refolding chaperone
MKPMLRSILILTLAALPMLAQSGPGPGLLAKRIAKVLNLTDAQKASIQAIHEKHKPDMVLKRDTVKQARTALQAALAVPATPAAQLRPLYDAAAAARFDMMMAQRSVQQEVQAVLTPEQRAKAAELRGLAQAGRFQRMHRPGMAG